MHAHNGSGFDTWIVLNSLDCDKGIVNVIKNGKGIIESKVFNGYIEKNKKQIPQYLHFRCGMTHLKKIFGYLMLKWMFYLLLIVMPDILKLWRK